jgi:hypothetical protein
MREAALRMFTREAYWVEIGNAAEDGSRPVFWGRHPTDGKGLICSLQLVGGVPGFTIRGWG